MRLFTFTSLITQFIIKTLLAVCPLMFCALSLQAQQGYRWFLSMGPSVSTGNRFEGGVTSISASDITGKHIIQPLFSPLWGRPNPEYSGLQNFGRKIHFAVHAERYFSAKHSVIGGLEIGSKGYIIISEQSNDLLINYRTISLPLLYSYGNSVSGYWNLRKQAGFVINYASSIPKFTKGTIELKKRPSIYPTFQAGIELIHNSFRTPFSFQLSYSHGFYNVIDHSYYALDYRNPVKILSNGSGWHIAVKYLLRETRLREKEPKPELTKYDLLAYREVKEPKELQLKYQDIRVCLLDDQTIDGDSVAIEFNNILTHKDILLSREGLCFDLHLKEGVNLLVVHALNEGKIPPNTCVVTVSAGAEVYTLRLKSDMISSGAIRLIY